MQVILTHENADFDAIASLLGAHKLYPDARPVLPYRVNRNVQAFLSLYAAGLPFVDPETLTRGHHIRRVILVDTQKLTTVRGLSEQLQQVLVIDHHEPPDEQPTGWRYQIETLGATTTLLVEVLSARLMPISPVEATLMLAGIYEDTGSLTYASTTPRDLRAAAWLIDQGANLEIATEFLDHPLTPNQQLIYEELHKHLETVEIDGHPILLSWANSPPETEEEVSTLAHKLRGLFEPSALFILVGIGEHTQLVARSTTDDINVAEVAQRFGGGGHDRAAAALVRHRSPEAVFAELCELLPEFVRPRVQVRDLMSYGVRTARRDETVEALARRMLRTGHEGYPVVDDDDRVVGLVTRNAVDRALQHRWEQEPIHRIMQAGNVTVAPEDSIEHVRALMIQSGWGQIPVVADGSLLGVVTRTDMLRLPASAYAGERERIAYLMEQAFPAPLLALLRRIGTRAAEEGAIIYFVGGIVRDVLLGQPIVDVDLVVEGDAIALGKMLAAQYGGEVRTHNRFGTAKWLLPADIWQTVAGQHPPSLPAVAEALLPQAIDLVTARTEFYERPTALPMVTPSSIKQDLHRRDFTINTLAIRLDPQRWGELLDFYGGRDDLEEGVIRVLHSLSFVDDPTRILRAARFEARLGFRLGERSESLVAEALPLLDRVTGGRISHELDLIFKEERPEAVLDRLQQLGVLQQLHAGLASDAWLHAHFRRLREEFEPAWWDMGETLDEEELVFLHWALFLARLNFGELTRLKVRLLLSRRLGETLQRLPEARTAVAELVEAGARPAAAVARLDAYALDVLAVAWLVIDDPAGCRLLARYAREWRHVQPSLTGEDLKALGFAPGPLFREIFRALRTARLEGEVRTREEEVALVEQTFAENRQPEEHYG